jgi:hypothetical protein
MALSKVSFKPGDYFSAFAPLYGVLKQVRYFPNRHHNMKTKPALPTASYGVFVQKRILSKPHGTTGLPGSTISVSTLSFLNLAGDPVTLLDVPLLKKKST